MEKQAKVKAFNKHIEVAIHITYCLFLILLLKFNNLFIAKVGINCIVYKLGPVENPFVKF